MADQCPVDHTKFQKPAETTNQEAKCPVDHKSMSSSSESSEEAKCPVDPSAYQHFLPPPTKTAEGCESDAINAANNMPNLSQQPSPGQKMKLSVEREISTIPRSGDPNEKIWIYPSEQMFFNAMRRKNWDPKEKDMEVVVPIHNAVNEQAWQKILQWEKRHETTCAQPKLVKFQGKPKDITPKARIRSWFGYKLPFDRHDWVVDRCGEKVTYVIDFYSGKANPNAPGSVSFFLDVRPALSPAGVWDRIKMSFEKGEWL
ncbi:hypothetical protein K450DRAFT_226157 [Umbelopsis ramanniana AG]|uniref:Holocytochrome c-type synthase n=1 Tax=Umbelopsis ramanniana AG TaxID=1314678 RepID=A0AAD5EEX3_UMBRA|nr:uncharacterized protein K450DRAFT_226157 [Umbelopsis ramanniana AG]KAI8582628.1 hypothetical protein K450DRAFT_226157 [Umbelopsis ramanniana AG]